MSRTKSIPGPDDKAIGARARLLRERKALSLRDVAREAKRLGIKGLSIGTLCDLENGKTVWDTSYASRVADVLGVTTAEIFIGVMLNQPPIAQHCTVAAATG